MAAFEPERPRPLVELGPKGHYRIPTAVQVKGVGFPSTTMPLRIHLILESGHELDIPVTQESLDELYQVLKSMATKP